MIAIMLTADAAASIILLVIAIAGIAAAPHRTVRDKVFVGFVGLNLLMCLCDMASWMCDGKPGLDLVNSIMSAVTFVGAYATTYMFARYLIISIESHHPVNPIHNRLLAVYTAVATAITAFLCTDDSLYSIIDSRYVTGRLYDIHIASVLAMYIYVLVVSFLNFSKISSYERNSFIIYCISPLISVVIEVIRPDLSLTYPSTAISILIIYILLQGQYRQRALEREKQLIESSRTDDLTKVMNRRAFNSMVESMPMGSMTGVIYCDINGLKYFNDTYGHSAGDGIVVKLANLLLENFKREEIYRISGDEFVVLCTSLDKESFETHAEKLKENDPETGYIIAATGCSYGRSDDIQRLMRSAEESMYVQKTIFHRKFPQYVKRGSLFTRYANDDTNELTVPAVETDGQSASTASGAKPSHTLLLIEDTEQHTLVRNLLESAYKVLDCRDVQSGLTLLATHSETDLVLIDSDMPRVNGFEFLQIKQADPVLSAVPVIVTASTGERNMESRYLRLGAFDFIHRPYSPDMLLNRLQRTVEMKESAATLSAVEKDELTGLYTRQVFCHRALRMLEQDRDESYDTAIFDIQNFRLINERHGVKMADSILRSIGVRLSEICGENGFAGRYSGDQFICIIRHSAANGRDFWEQLTRSLECCCSIDQLTIKCGIYENVDHSISGPTLCYKALLALRTVKHRYGEICATFDEQLQLKVNREQQLEQEMAAAGREEQFRVFYQPKCDAATGRLVGAEALLRWKHPGFGLLPPDEFIPLFERNGFITNTDFFVWEHTAQSIKRWSEMGLKPVPVSVNSSRRDFSIEGHRERMLSAISRCGIDPSLMHIEVTETMFTERADELAEELDKYRSSGILVELDDFGSGYSALNILGSLPIDEIKFDKSFVRHIDDARSSHLLEQSIRLVKNMGFTAVIEGVETRAQRDAVVAMGADTIQGYFYSKPLPEAEFEEYLKREAISSEENR